MSVATDSKPDESPPPQPVEAAESEAAPPPPAPLQGEVCVRYCGDGGEVNEAFDVLHFHDELGYRLTLEDLDEKFEFLGDCSGDWSCHLIREDGNARYEARTWMAKVRAEACFDGPANPLRKAADERSVGVFTNLVPEAQYRLGVVREQRKAAGVVADPFGLLSGSGLDCRGTAPRPALDIRNDDTPTGEDRASCSCVEGNPCASAYNCRDWGNRFDVARQNGWRG
jgi:hypothetical protein